ncbi:MAG TPA: radical SAM family heme chaperone HemW [Hyphomicrobiaceae bacterium]|nr:radical SAM family heme chaperone HemW [Hyphomicrobiaceae bacterium]
MRSAIAPAPSPGSSLPASASNPDEAGFGVYVHWPFCASKCPYCDFNSHVRADGIDEPRFLAALQRELRYQASLSGPRAVTSVFLGGGTPSLMQPATVAGILDCIAACWSVPPDAEITLEANPGSVEAGRFTGYRTAGVNRVSLGVQSLRDDALRALGRRHTVAEAKAALEVARRTFDRFSFDLIYARPGQTIDDWRAELKDALTLTGSHLSLYQLTIEPGTPFAALAAVGRLTLPEPDSAARLFEVTQGLAAAAGLPAYEISNHAAPGEECRHNLLYWRYGEYVGAGPGAHGRLFIGGRRHQTATERAPEQWLGHVEARGHGLTETAPLSAAEQADEALLMGLRLEEGLDLERLKRIGGRGPRVAVIEALIADGLLERTGAGRIKAAARGRLLLNEVVLRLSRSLVPADA